MKGECTAVIEEMFTADDYYSGHWCGEQEGHEGPHHCGACSMEWETHDDE